MPNETRHETMLGHITDELCELILTINLASISPVLALIGLSGNIINIIVFVTQGFYDTVNISLLALAVSDMGTLLNGLVISILSNPILLGSEVWIEPKEFQTYVSGWPIASFSKITSWITAYITFERCLCVVTPLKVKRVLTPKIVVFIMVAIYVTMFAALTPEYMGFYLTWKYIPYRNKTVIGIVPTGYHEAVKGITFRIHTFSQFVSFPLVILFTVVLIVKLRQKSKWRVKTTSGAERTLKNADKKESKTIKMITAVAVLHIVCYMPAIIDLIIAVTVPEFYIVGLYKNSFLVAFTFPALFEGVNSSLSIFLYFKMSTKYRVTFNAIFKQTKNK